MGITPSTLLAIVLCTFLIGVILGFIGAGGAGVLLGLLSGVFDLPIGQAIGTALAAMCVVTVSGAVSHFREGNVVWRIGLIVGASGVAGAAAGATLSQDVSDTILRLGAGLALWALALLVWIAVIRHQAPYTLLAATLTPVGPVGIVIAIAVIEKRRGGAAKGVTRSAP